MVSLQYMQNRKEYQRPQGLLFANNPGTIINGVYVPNGNEFQDFIILSDDNRGPISIGFDRIEQRERMINGRMRSYHIADKLQIGTSWSMLPSRGYSGPPGFDEQGNTSYRRKEEKAVVPLPDSKTKKITLDRQQYTTDNGAGGVEILNWYEDNPGSFWVYLAYDKYSNFESQAFNRLGQYNQIVEVFFSGFDYTIQKRGGSNFDFWDISLDLEEV
jgi:hypothetical protein